MLTTAKKSIHGLVHKRLTGLGLLMATAMGGYAIYLLPVQAQNQPDVILYEGQNFTGKSFPISQAAASLGSFNNKAASIRILNNQKWQFWANKNFQGKSITLAPGNYPRLQLSNDIESLRSVK